MVGRHGGDVDDVAASLLCQQFTKDHGRQHRAGDIQVKDPLEGVHVEVEEVQLWRDRRLLLVAACAVDENVDVAVLCHNGVARLFQAGAVEDVGLDGNSIAARGVDLVGDLLCILDEEVEQGNLRALLRHLARHDAADDAARAGDDGYLPADVKINFVHLFSSKSQTFSPRLTISMLPFGQRL